ncbi:MAG: hypothetical protein IT373_11640 [Polyangiaceae bacterium]|nr:hypothetical protein [Polyangiaceae bacterium]
MLEAAGLEGRSVAGLAREVQAPRGDREAFRSAYRDAIAHRIRVRPWPLASTERQVVTVVGPPGVGKTTTVAKLAARALFEHDRRVALVTCDTYRVGAIDHIWRYASLLGVELSVARDARNLREAVAGARADIVLVDTAGRGPTEGDSAEGALATLADHPAAPPIERRVLLCLPAEVRAADAEALVTQFAPYKPTELVVTKLDLTRSPGGLLHGMLASGLAVSAICAGQRVPEDIQPATAGVILDQLTPKIP